MNAFERHEATLRHAWQACKTRGFWSPFPDVPGKYPDADAARIAGRQAYAAHLGQDFEIDQPGRIGWLGAEVSPYTREPLGVRYPQSSLNVLFDAAQQAMDAGWRQADPEQRLGALMEVTNRLYRNLFEIVYAVFHTTGQSFNMSYAGSGVNALDRGIEALAYAWDAMAGDAKKAAMILAAIQSNETLHALQWLLDEGRRSGRVLLEPRSYAHPEFPQARTATPLMLQIGKDRRDLYGEERFGPVSFVIEVDDAEDALAQACADVRAGGGLTAFLYALDEDFIARAHGPMPLNFAAAYSDYHVTGLNPAGNASLTDHAFVASRFRIVQSRRPVPVVTGALA